MKKFKFILPALAFVFAMALSFASVKSVDSYAPLYVQYPGSCEFFEDIPCNGLGDETCTVFSSSLNTELDVYEDVVDPQNPTTCQIEVTDNRPGPVTTVP